MAGYTKNFNLKLPSDIEFYDIEDFNENFEKIDQMAVKKGEGIGELTGGALSDRPEPGIAGRYYFAQDTGEIFLDTGEEWVLAAASQKELAAHKANYATQNTLGHIKLSDIPSTVDDIGAFGPSNYGNIVSSTVDLTLNLSHANTVLVYGTTSARTITVPNNSSVPFPIGTQITVIRNSTGTVTFIPASGVTLNSKDNKRSIDGRYASATLIKTATNTWMLIGALE